MIRIIEKWKIWFAISLIVIVPGLVALFAFGLNFGIDFSGGTIIEIQFPGKESLNLDDVRACFNDNEIKNPVVSLTSSDTFLAKTHFMEQDSKGKITSCLAEKIGELKEVRYESVGASISKDLTQKAVWAVILASLMIILYIAYAFRSVPKPLSSWKFGISAVIALVHDLLVVIGAFAILGHFLGVEIDTLFITALLTVMGFSVHDTIVVFDRIRENLKTASGDLKYIANKSVAETMARSINTSVTVLFTLLALLLFGGSSTFWFIFALLVGIIAGTYSSIFVASVIVVLWHKNVKI